jgi:hypothetical protein
MRAREESNAIACVPPVARLGVLAVWTHDVPSHSQVSEVDAAVVPVENPPKRTVLPRRESYAIEGRHRAGGAPALHEAVVHISRHSAPSHSHVSPRGIMFHMPPNRTVFFRLESYAITASLRTGGSVLQVVLDKPQTVNQLLPSHSHVPASPKVLVHPVSWHHIPPKSTDRSLALSKAIDVPIVVIGSLEHLPVGHTCVHAEPSHSQVSLNDPVVWPDGADVRPPKRTNRFRTESYVAA